jgi:hypothetical protein
MTTCINSTYDGNCETADLLKIRSHIRAVILRAIGRRPRKNSEAAVDEVLAEAVA